MAPALVDDLEFERCARPMPYERCVLATRRVACVQLPSYMCFVTTHNTTSVSYLATGNCGRSRKLRPQLKLFGHGWVPLKPVRKLSACHLRAEYALLFSKYIVQTVESTSGLPIPNLKWNIVAGSSDEPLLHWEITVYTCCIVSLLDPMVSGLVGGC